MVFTEDDAQNDGLIKKEVGREMAKVAKTQNPEMFNFFKQACDEVGREPADVLGEYCVRALNDEAFADQVMQAEVNMRKLRADDINLEDIKYVKNLADELGLNDTQEQQDPIEKLINQRLESVTSSPMEQLQERRQNNSQGNSDQMEHIQSLQNEINRLQQKIDDGEGGESQEGQAQQQSSSKSVDDLFDDGDTEEETDEVEEGSVEEDFTDDSKGEETVQISQGNNSTDAKPEPEPEEELPDEAIEEAMSGVGDSDDGAEVEEGEELEMDIDIPTEDDEEIDDMFTSEDGVEE